MLQTLLRPVARIALDWYYRSIVMANAERLPREGPLFIAVNHPNALVDALVVGSMVPRRVVFTAKATIFANPLVARFLSRAGVVPLRRVSDEAQAAGAAIDLSRNASAFGAVAEALGSGLAVVIFPEGKSHDDPQLAPLRTGLARMALMARDEHGVRGIRIVPVGILFERKEEPRSRVLLRAGEPIAVDAAPGGPDGVSVLTAVVAERLRAVTVNFESAEDAERINRAADLLAALITPRGTVDDSTPTLQETLAVIRRTERVDRAIRERNDPHLVARAATAEQRLRAFRQRLHDAGLRIEDVMIDTGTASGIRFLIREGLRASILFPLSLWGRATHFVPLRLTRWLALRQVKHRDEPAMRTLVIGLVLVLAAYAIETVLVALVAGVWWALLFAVTLVPSASTDFRYSDRTRQLRARARAWMRFRRDPALQHELRIDAEWLRGEAGAIERLALGA